MAAIVTDRHRSDHSLVTEHHGQCVAGRRIPEANGFVPASAGDEIASRRVGHRGNHSGMSLDCGDGLTVRNSPEAHRLIPTRGGNPFARR